MGKGVYANSSDSEETEDASSSVENTKKTKKKFSILKFTRGSLNRNKCKAYGRSEVDEPEFKSQSNVQMKTLRGILKHSSRKSSDAEDEEYYPPPRPASRYLVGTVPRSPRSRPGCCGGVSILIIRKNNASNAVQRLQAQCSINNTRRRFMERMAK